MRRKVIRQGHNTFTLTLPIKWAKNMNLQAGTELDVSEQGGNLIVSALAVAPESTTTEVDISGLPNPLLWRFVSAAYRAGYGTIKIDFGGIESDKDRLKEFSYDIADWFYRGELPKGRVSRLSAIEAIQALINRFVGVEITDQRQDYVIVSQLGEISYKEFDNALKRIFMVIISMGKDILKAIREDDLSVLKAIHMIDSNIDRFEDYCLRVLNLKGYEDYKKTSTIYATIFTLELVGDEYKRIAKHVIADKPKYGSGCLKFFNEINEQFESYFDLFYHFDRQKAIKVFETEDQLTASVIKLLKNASDGENELLHHLKKIGRQTISLVELAIDLRADTAFGIGNGAQKK